jgi:uncharacterized protein
MHCPVDQATLVMTERHGIAIDSCPECRGIWLDRNELDAIINRNGMWSGDPVFGNHRTPSAPPAARTNAKAERRKKRKEFLTDLFEFGG